MTPSRLELAVVILAVLLRVYLAVVNTEANDDHLTVIRMIADQHHFPGLREAWEGFQPKLYHATVALLWKLSPWTDPAVRVRVAQLVSCAAGIATVIALRRGLSRTTVSPGARRIALALAALNPALVGLNAQATNDSFVILFGVMALICASEFFQTWRRTAFVWMTGFTALAVLSKGNGLVVFVAIAAAAATATASLPLSARRRHLKRVAVFAGTVVVAAVAFGPFRANFRDTGNPFAINGPPAPWPHLFERTYVFRPGTTSIVDTYLTFRLADMLRHPGLTNDTDIYPLHRTSLWSQLHGRAHSTHFAQHPPSWRNTSPAVSLLTRVLLVVTLLPTAILLTGMVRVFGELLTWMRHRGGEVDVVRLLPGVVAWGYVGFIVMYTFTYRDFATMKAEFLLPGLFAYVALFAREFDRLEAALASRPRAAQILRVGLVLTLLLYVADIAALAGQLT